MNRCSKCGKAIEWSAWWVDHRAVCEQCWRQSTDDLYAPASGRDWTEIRAAILLGLALAIGAGVVWAICSAGGAAWPN